MPESNWSTEPLHDAKQQDTQSKHAEHQNVKQSAEQASSSIAICQAARQASSIALKAKHRAAANRKATGCSKQMANADCKQEA